MTIETYPRKFKAYPESPFEAEAKAQLPEGICRNGNHALCIRNHRFGKHTHNTDPSTHTAPSEDQVERAMAWLALGDWQDGAGSYGLKHRVEDASEADNGGHPLYCSNGALLLAARRMGLGIVWAFWNSVHESPNGWVFKLGRVPGAKRGRKASRSVGA